MPPFRLAAALLIPLQFASIGIASARRASPESAAPSPGTDAAPLSEQDILFAHHRILGTEPDFRVMAEREVDRRPPPARAPRDPERERRYLLTLAERRLRAEFAAFDPGRRFRIRVGTEILGYDRASGGIPLRTGIVRGISMRDPTDRERGFTLRFRDPDAVRIIPAATPRDAERVLHDAGLASLGNWAGTGTLTVEFVFAGALPALPELGEPPVLAEIVAARVENGQGRPIHRFATPGSAARAAAARRAGFPALRQAAPSGLRIGMPLPAARDAALRENPLALGSAFYGGLAAGRRGADPRCSAGLVADIRAFNLPVAPENRYASCLAITPDEEGKAVAGITQLRFVPGATPGALRQDLEGMFGPAEGLSNGQLFWAGQDPAREEPRPLLELRADMAEVEAGGPEGEAGTLLSLTIRPLPLPDAEG